MIALICFPAFGPSFSMLLNVNSLIPKDCNSSLRHPFPFHMQYISSKYFPIIYVWLRFECPVRSLYVWKWLFPFWILLIYLYSNTLLSEMSPTFTQWHTLTNNSGQPMRKNVQYENWKTSYHTFYNTPSTIPLYGMIILWSSPSCNLCSTYQSITILPSDTFTVLWYHLSITSNGDLWFDCNKKW